MKVSKKCNLYERSRGCVILIYRQTLDNLINMKKIFLLLVLISFNLPAQINTKVYGIELDSIQQWVKQKPKYFEYLERKFQKTDLKEDELILLYYGSTFLPGYQPKQADREVEKIAKLMGEMDFDAGLKVGESLLKKYPVEARLYMLTGYAAKKTGDRKKSKFYYKKYADLVRVPMYSGTGESFDKAYVVRSTSDEFLIVNQKNLEMLKMEVRYNNKRPFDKMILSPKSNPKDKKEVYFNTYLPFFIANHTDYKAKQKEAILKFKMDTTKYRKKIKKLDKQK